MKARLFVFYPLLRRKELRTTEMLEADIATAAKMGLSKMLKNGYKTPAATGIKAIL